MQHQMFHHLPSRRAVLRRLVKRAEKQRKRQLRSEFSIERMLRLIKKMKAKMMALQGSLLIFRFFGNKYDFFLKLHLFCSICCFLKISRIGQLGYFSKGSDVQKLHIFALAETQFVRFFKSKLRNNQSFFRQLTLSRLTMHKLSSIVFKPGFLSVLSVLKFLCCKDDFSNYQAAKEYTTGSNQTQEHLKDEFLGNTNLTDSFFCVYLFSSFTCVVAGDPFLKLRISPFLSSLHYCLLFASIRL